MLTDVKLQDICAVDWGNTSLTKKAYVEGSDFLAVSATGADGRIGHYEHEENVCVLSAIGAQCGKMFFPQQQFTAIKNTITLTPKQELVDGKYLYFLFTAIELPKRGAAQPFISKGDIEKFVVSYIPPLAEQQRIVAKLDAAFAEIDIAIAAAEKNAENAEAIYAYAINAMFAEHSDKAVRIGDYSKINYGYTAKASHDKGEYKFLRITDIQEGAVNWGTVPYCDVDNKKISNVLLKDGDIVFARTGATTGKSFLVRNPVNAVFASYLIRVSLEKEKFLPDFVLHYFQSEEYWRQVDEGTSGAAQGGFNASKLSQLMLPLISIGEQVEVTEHLNRISQKSSSLKEMYVSKAKELYMLKASLLAAELTNMSEAA
jgi:type I restriction enzyme, S subunit